MSEPSLADRFFVDATSPAFRDDPYPLYEAYRSEDPLLRVADTIWFVLGHDEVSALLRDPRLSSDERRAATEAGVEDLTAKSRSLLFMDPPDHTRLRRLVARAFTARRVDALRRTTEASTAELLDGLADAVGEVDLIATLAYPLPVRVICGLLGVPAADEHRFHVWSRALTRALDPSILRSAADDLAIADAEVALAAYLDALLDDRRRRPTDDLLGALVAGDGNGEDTERATSQEIVDLASLLLIAGHETTVNLIGNGILALLEHPDQLDRLHRDPGLVPGAVDELLRYDSPVQLTQRVAVDDLELAGHQVRAGDELVLVLGAANRDPAVFADPHRLDVTRDARRHVSFGGGIHHCLGAALARMEGEVAIAALLDRFPTLERSGPVGRRPTLTLRGLDSLPVRTASIADRLGGPEWEARR